VKIFEELADEVQKGNSESVEELTKRLLGET
jgi:hypothetical protein